MATDTTTAPADPPGTVPVIREHIAIKPGYCGGKPHIDGHRIKVQLIAELHTRSGMTPAEIAEVYPSISLAAVHAALAYYYDHKDQIEADIAEDARFVAEMKAKAGPSRLQKLLAEEYAKDDSLPPR